MGYAMGNGVRAAAEVKKSCNNVREGVLTFILSLFFYHGFTG